MASSVNTLVIDSIEYKQEDTGLSFNQPVLTIRYEGKLKAYIQFVCPITGNTFKKINIESFATGSSPEDIIRQAVQNFLDGKVGRGVNIYNVNFECIPDNKRFHHLHVSIPDPWNKLFRDLFTPDKWTVDQFKLGN